MTALSADFNSYAKNVIGKQAYTAQTGSAIYKGGMVMTSAGYIWPANSTTAGTCVMGRASDSLATTDTVRTLAVERGSFFMNTGATNQPTIANVGGLVYVEDDNTVSTDSTKPVAGILEAVENSGVLVRIDPIIGDRNL